MSETTDRGATIGGPMRQRTRWRLLTAMAGLALACTGSDAAWPTATVTGVGWYEENIDPSFLISPPPNGNTAFFDFWLHYDGDIAFGDLQYARVYLPDGSFWNLAPTADFLDTTNKTIGGWRRWWWSASPHLLPIGPMRAEVKLKSGLDSSYSFSVPVPGSSTSGTYATMYTDDATSPSLASAPMVRRATPGATNTVTAATQTITITFSVVDTKVYDGWVWFYDTFHTYLGVSKYLTDPATGVASPLLAGSVLHTDGTTNTLTLSASDVSLVSGKTFDQIAAARVVLTDGAQYTSTTHLRYDCRSISALAPLTEQ
jgi:hypothetical protein